MSDARRKERKRLKREKKRNEIRRLQSVSPYQRLSQGDVVECRINSDWRQRGQAAGFILRQGPDGKLGMAAFMVDSWCAGLKDIWGRLDIFREDYDHAVQRMSEQMDGTVKVCSLEEAAGVLAGGIRFAQQNHFRLPPHYQRWAALFGPVEAANADLTHFGVEGGKLRWYGPLFDLQNRYLGRVEDFLARGDVEYIVGVDEEQWEDDDEDEDDFDEDDEQDDDLPPELVAFVDAIDQLADSISQWCETNNVIVSRGIRHAIVLKLHHSFVKMNDDPEQIESINRMVHALRNGLSIEDQAELLRAEKQVDEFFQEIEKLGSDAGMPAESKPAAETSPGPAL